MSEAVPEPVPAEFTGANQGRRTDGEGVLEFVDEDGEHHTLQLPEDELAELYDALHSWGVWFER